MSIANLTDLRWYRLRAVLLNQRFSPLARAHPFSVCQAIVKRVTSRLVPGSIEALARVPVFFHLPGRKHNLNVAEGDRIQLEVFVCVNKSAWAPTAALSAFNGVIDEAFANAWRDAFCAYMSEPEASKNYKLAWLGELEERKLADLIRERGVGNAERELGLEFLSPLPFTREAGQKRTALTVGQFIRAYENRFSRLFGDNIYYSSGQDAFSLITDHWHYTEIRHSSKSQPGGMQFLNGCAGRLYIEGAFDNFYPFLLLGSELHAGTRLANSQGYYRFCAAHRSPIANCDGEATLLPKEELHSY